MQTRRKREQEALRDLLEHATLSDVSVPIHTAAEYLARMAISDFQAWTSMMPSPLGGRIDITACPANLRLLGSYNAPNGDISPGIVAECLYDAGMFAEFQTLVCDNQIAYEHIMRLESTDMPNAKMDEAQSLARSARAKEAAFDVLADLMPRAKHGR